MNQKAIQILQKADVDKLPSLSQILLQLLDVCHEKSLSYKKLAKIIKLDPALYIQFFALCHQAEKSPQPGNTPQPSFEQLLQQLGVNTIKSVAVTATVHRHFSRHNSERTDFLKQHWRHSLHCAIVAESIAKLCQYKRPDDAYTAGLLHDIGQLILETSYPEKYTTSLAQLTEDDHFQTMEMDTFSATHLQVGASLLTEYGANRFICDAILYHHERIEHILDAHPLVKITYLANTLTNRFFNAEEQKIFEAAKQLLDLDKTVLLEILEQSQERVSNAAQWLEILFVDDNGDNESTHQHNTNDEFKQVQLANQVKNIALLDGIHQQMSRSQGKDLLKIISQHIGLLFDIDYCTLFLYDKDDKRLYVSVDEGQPHQLAELSIPVITGRSLVADALVSKQLTHSFDEELNQLSILDRQLIGLTGRQGIVCLPMLIDDITIGTLVLGVDASKFEGLQKQQQLLTRFADEVAHTISANHDSSKSESKQHPQNSPNLQKIHEILHEARNPLSIMNNYLGILSYKLESNKPAQEDVQTIKSEINRVSEILNRLTETENITDKTSLVDINTIITELSNVFQASLFNEKNIQISLDLDERLNKLQSNANTLKQIYTNLVKNAVEALSANGEVMVYTQDNVNVDGVQNIEICVADNGPGIDEEILPILFSPVKTTKGEDHEGLGLTIVKNLVNELHGSISCRSSSEGTSFHILLPKQLNSVS